MKRNKKSGPGIFLTLQPTLDIQHKKIPEKLISGIVWMINFKLFFI